MKKFIKYLLFFCLMFFSPGIFAQTSILEKIKEQNLQELLSVYPPLPKHDVQAEAVKEIESYARARSNAHSATERVRIPDLSKGSDIKYYYIKNVKTGKYLRYEGANSPLGVVDVPDGNSRFYFEKHGLGLTTGAASLHNAVDGKVFVGPSENRWINDKGSSLEELTNPSPVVGFYPALDKSGCYIAGDFNIENTGEEVVFDMEMGAFIVKRGWRYDVESNAVVIGDCDEYAVWVAEPLPTAPIVSTTDTVWFVAKNVKTGKFLRYEGENSTMSLVTSPDPSSLFFTTLSTGGRVMVHSYAAGDLLYEDINRWTSVGTPVMFTLENSYHCYVSVSGDKAGNDVLYHDESTGTLAKGPFGENSLWEFEQISNLKEIFGYTYNGEKTLGAYNDYYELLNNIESLNPFEAYVKIIECIVDMFVGAVGYLDMGTLGEIDRIDEELDILLEQFPKNMEGDAKIYNISYSDDAGETLMRSLSTNSTSLLINKFEHSHTNAWQLLPSSLIDLNTGFAMRLYNTVTNSYVSAPSFKDGKWTVSMTSDEKKAGKWIVGLEPRMEGNWVYMETKLESKDVAGCFLQLASPDDFAVSCTTNSGEPGLDWLVAMGPKMIDKRVYDCAAESAVLFPQLLQEAFGAVKAELIIEGEYEISPSVGTEVVRKLYDIDVNTSVWTDEANDKGDEHYITVNLGEGRAFSDFYFYLRPNINSWTGVPLSIKVEGSNSKESGYVTLADNIEMPTLMYDMCYFSEMISGKGGSYRYLRFTVTDVTTGENARAFSLSEFYVLPSTSEVAEASSLIRTFYTASYMEPGIVASAVALILREAEYYLSIYESNHAEAPELGQYPSSKYNALKSAYAAAKANINNAENILSLVAALDEFKKSKLTYICMFESAWEDGFSKGSAVSINFDTGVLEIQEANAWDMRQWGILDRSGDKDNPYLMKVISGEVMPFCLDEIEGWNTLYASKKKAYNISIKLESNGEKRPVYLSVREDDGLSPYFSFEPATTTENKQVAWYVNIIGKAGKNPYVRDLFFIEALAYFGKTFGEAKYYEEGYRKGLFVYQSDDNSLTKDGFDQVYSTLEPFYNYGAITLAEMYANGEFDDSMFSDLSWALEELRRHFPNFVMVNNASDIAGLYFRLRGSDGRYLTSDANGSFSFSANASDNGIYYIEADGDEVSVLSFSSGRYVKANANGSLGYDEIPLDGGNRTTQVMRVINSLSGNNNKASIVFGENLYLYEDGATPRVTTTFAYDERFDWEAEVVSHLPISISSAQYATLYVPVELVIPNGVTAYVLYDEVTNPGGERVLKLRELQGGRIPAGLPVVLHAEEGVYYFQINYDPNLVSDVAKRDTYSKDGDIENLLDGRHATTYIPEKNGYIHYILANGSKGVGMYKVKMDDANVGGVNYFQNNAHRAWLPNPKSITTGAAGYRFFVAGRDEATSIDAAVDDSTETEIYDLQGRRVPYMTKGVYIVNGKKVVK